VARARQPDQRGCEPFPRWIAQPMEQLAIARTDYEPTG
jgi:hypothetical protein